MNDLISFVSAAVDSGAVPLPVPGEQLDSYRLRAAHAGAVVGAKWFAERQKDLADAEHAAQHPEQGTVEGVVSGDG